MEVVNKEGDKKKAKEEKPSKEFAKFLDEIALKTPKAAKNLINEYTSKANEAAEYSDSILSYAKVLVKKAIKKDKQELEESLAKISSEDIQPPVFSLKTIKDLDRVEDCFMEEGKLVIITKERKFKKYKSRDAIFTADWEYTMPAYKIEYLSTNQSIANYRDTVPKDYQINPKETKLGYKVMLLKDTDIDELKDPREQVKNEIFSDFNIPGAYANPYQTSANNYERDQGAGAVCYGGSSSMQTKHITENEILPHAINLLTTLYTEDNTGRGHSNWLSRIIRHETIANTLKLKEVIGNFEGAFNIYADVYGYEGEGRVDSSIKMQKTNDNYENPLKLEANKFLKTNIKQVLNESDHKDLKLDSYDLEITEIELENSDSFRKNDGISQINTTLKLIVDEEVKGYADISWDKEDIIKLGNIITPKGKFKAKDFNKFIKNMYETDIAPRD